MKKMIKQLLLVLAMAAVMALAGCGDSDQGPMQTAGEKMDNAVDKTREVVGSGIEKGGEAVKGGADKTGDAVKSGADKTKDAVGQ